MNTPPVGQPKKHYRKQVLLFGISVLLPGVVLLFFTLRMNRQDNELRTRRAEEVRQQKAEEIGLHMADRMERAEQVYLQELSTEAENSRAIHLTPSELVLVSRVKDGKLQMPWEIDEEQLSSPQDNRSGELILQAHDAEFSRNDFQLALSLLNQALSLTTSAAQKDLVKLQIGRILLKSGDENEALRLYRDLLEQPGELTDEYGIPLSLYAADKLSGLGQDFESVLDRLARLVTDSDWLPPAALYFIRDIIEQVEANIPDSHPSDDVRQLRQSVENAIANVEKTAGLRTFVAGWDSRHDLSLRTDGTMTWEAYGDVPWLLSVRGDLKGDSRYLFAFDGPEVLDLAIEESGLSDTFPGTCRLAVEPVAEGISPGGSFQGLRLQFEETAVSEWSGSSLPFPLLYWSILILVVGFTAFGMYLLWRDVRRELILADMKSQFAANVSHELKTPLTAIRMFAEALAMGVKNSPASQQEYLRTIIGESERLSRLLNNVLDFSKIEQGTRTYRFEPISLDDVVRTAAKAMTFSLRQKGFSFEVDVDPDIPRVRADKDAIEQAVINLLDNAMKYSGSSRNVRLELHQRENTVCIDVVDFGIGISEENKARIFQKFFRAPGHENQRTQGTGLGLTIVSHIAEAHGGRVEVISRPGEGTTFSIILPLEEE